MGTNNWDAQLLSGNLSLESGAAYTGSFTIKSSVARKVTVGVQSDNGSTQHGGAYDLELTAGETKTLSFDVDQSTTSYNNPTFYISMGKFENETSGHTITISNLSLVKKSSSEDNAPLIADVNGNLLAGIEPWTDPSYVALDGTKITVKQVGDQEYSAQLSLGGLTLENGAAYTGKCEIKSSVGRTVGAGVQENGGSYTTYGNAENTTLQADQWTTLTFEVKRTDSTSNSAKFYINIGKFTSDGDLSEHTITIRNLSLVKNSGSGSGDTTSEPLIKDDSDNILKSSSISFNANGCVLNGTTVTVTSVGTNAWDAQLLSDNLIFENDATYTGSCTIKSSVARKVTVGVQSDNGSTQNGAAYNQDLAAGTPTTITFTASLQDSKTNSDLKFFINMGKIGDADLGEHTITISNLSLVKNADSRADANNNQAISTASLDIEDNEVENPEETESKTDEPVTEDATESDEETEEVTSMEQPAQEESTGDETFQKPEMDEPAQEESTGDETESEAAAPAGEYSTDVMTETGEDNPDDRDNPDKTTIPDQPDKTTPPEETAVTIQEEEGGDDSSGESESVPDED